MAATQIRNGQLRVTTDFDINSNKLTNVATPTSANDAATKAYVDATSAGRVWKDAVRVATTANITLSGAQTIDGVSAIAGDRVLVKDQTTASENGIYVVASGSWARATDADTDAEVKAGMTVTVEEGTASADSRWILTTDNPITVGTTDLAFTRDAGETISAGNGLTKTGSTIDVVSANDAIVANANDIEFQAADASLEITTGGARIPPGSSGQVMVSNGTIMAAQTISGDATIDGSGVVTLVSSVVKEADVVTEEIPTGSINGSNTSFSLANTPVTGSVRVYLNGIRQRSGGNDYSISGTTITMTSAPVSGDVLLVDYFK